MAVAISRSDITLYIDATASPLDDLCTHDQKSGSVVIMPMA